MLMLYDTHAPCRGKQAASFTGTSTETSSMEVALCLQSVAVVDRQATFTDTSTRISSMKIALCLQSVTVVDRQATFTGTSSRISSMVMALWLQSVPVWTDKPHSQILPPG